MKLRLKVVRRVGIQTPASPPTGVVAGAPAGFWSTEPATEKQIAYIKELGGVPRNSLTKQEASDFIGRLIDEKHGGVAPATERQIALIIQHGGTPPNGLTKQDASDFIDHLVASEKARIKAHKEQRPPLKKQIDFIRQCGEKVPATKKEAEALCQALERTTLATPRQKKQAEAYGAALPAGATIAEANQQLAIAERDADEEEGSPASSEQLDMIKELGGDSSKATNRWRTDEYIEQLEEQEEERLCLLEQQREEAEVRVQDAIDWFFADRDMTSRSPVKKPSKKTMGQALRFGDEQGWGENWESNHEQMFDLLHYALYSVAPNSLKPGWTPPERPSQLAEPLEAPQQTNDATPCPCCDYAIPVFLLKEGSNLCPSCQQTFNVRYD